MSTTLLELLILLYLAFSAHAIFILLCMQWIGLDYLASCTIHPIVLLLCLTPLICVWIFRFNKFDFPPIFHREEDTNPELLWVSSFSSAKFQVWLACLFSVILLPFRCFSFISLLVATTSMDFPETDCQPLDIILVIAL